MKKETGSTILPDGLQLGSGIRLPRPCTPVLRSQDLFRGDDNLILDHYGEFYTLSVLPSGRLMLIENFSWRPKRRYRQSMPSGHPD